MADETPRRPAGPGDAPPPIHTLTSLRFFAALAVFAHHLPFLGAYSPTAKIYAALRFYEGFSGVAFFFILSGFVLTYNYQHRLRSPGARGLLSFYRARFARIYPVHLLTFGLFVWLLPAWCPLTGHGRQAICNLALVQSFVPRTDYFFAYNPVSWSLSDEAFFYAVLPLLLWTFPRAGLSRRWPAFLAALAVCAAAYAWTWTKYRADNAQWLCYVNPLARLGEFTVGVLLALAFLRRPPAAIARRSVLRRLAGTVVELLSLSGLATALYYSQQVPLLFRLGAYYLAPMAVVVYVFAGERGYLSMVLRLRVLRWLGEISFAFYMFQQLVLSYVTLHYPTLPERLKPVPYVLAAILAVLALSAACYHLYESPVRSLLHGRWPRIRRLSRPANSAPAGLRRAA